MSQNNDQGRWDKVFEALGKLTATCDDIKEDLNYHMVRTDKLEEKLEPVEDHVKFIRKAGGIVFALGLALVGYLFV